MHEIIYVNKRQTDNQSMISHVHASLSASLKCNSGCALTYTVCAHTRWCKSPRANIHKMSNTNMYTDTWARKHDPGASEVFVGFSVVLVITTRRGSEVLEQIPRKTDYSSTLTPCGCNSWLFRAESLHRATGEKLILKHCTVLLLC